MERDHPAAVIEIQRSVTRDSSDHKRPDLYKITFLDIVLVVLILAVSTGIVLGTKAGLGRRSSRASEATVFQHGEVVQRLNLDEDQEVALSGGKMLVEVKQRKVRVKRSDCPRQVCVYTGWIQYPGESIICVPYKTLIEINSPDEKRVDAVVF